MNAGGQHNLNIERLKTERRFFAKVEVGSPGGCWNWLGALGGTDRKYGKFKHTKPNADYAHRVSYELFREQISDGLEIDHLCRNTRCVNPRHLSLVDHETNMARKIQPAVCPKGHLYTHKNMYHQPASDGRKQSTTVTCRECHRLREAARRTQKRLEQTNE